MDGVKLYDSDKESLQAHLQTYNQANAVSQIHEDRRTLEEVAFYPAHDPRRETDEYKAIHKKLCVDQDLPCLICGVRNSTLNSGEKGNPFGAKQMETHHHLIEWALANAIDADKFNKILLPNLRHKHPEKEEYKTEFAREQIFDWVDHSSDNLWVLCDIHHRHKFLGIHAITYPIWSPQNLLADDFVEYVRKQLGSEDPSKID